MKPKRTEGIMHQNFRYWTTRQEMEFLDGLGQHSKHPRSQKRLLENYLKAMYKRWDWGHINPGKIKEYAEKLLASY